MGDISEEDMIQIANNFLLASPPGEFMEVVTDVRGLLPDDSLINDTAPITFREYNTEQMLQVYNGDRDVLVSKHGEVSDSEYLDPRGGQVFTFDHIRQEVTGSRAIGGELDSAVEPYRSAADAAFEKYGREFYMNGTTAVYGKKNGGDFVLTLCLSSSKFNPNNFWNGRWRSIWTATFKPNGQVNVSGVMKVSVHYYEDGNVQLNTEVTKSASVAGGNPQATAENILKVIRKEEANYQQNVDNNYRTMGDTTFKALRRALPITRVLIDWNKILFMKMGGNR
jgi:capping protein alpha